VRIKSNHFASGNLVRSHVVLPVPRGPSRKKLWSGNGSLRVYIASILTAKMLAA
jgi:hypothetical protein